MVIAVLGLLGLALVCFYLAGALFVMAGFSDVGRKGSIAGALVFLAGGIWLLVIAASHIQLEA